MMMRVAIICDEGWIPRWLNSALTRMREIDGINLVLCLIASSACGRRRNLGTVEGWVFRRLFVSSRDALAEELKSIHTIRCDGTLPAGIDLAVDCRLEPCKTPTWAVRVGTCMLALEGAVGIDGLREVMATFSRRRSCLHFLVLLAATNEGGKAGIVREGAVRAATSHAQSIDVLLAAAGNALLSAIRELLLGVPLRQGSPHAPSPASKRLGSRTLGACYLQSARRFGPRLVKSAFYFEKWNIGICAVPPAGFLGRRIAPPATWIPESAGLSYLADPHATSGQSGRFLAEHFEERRNRGIIVSIKWDRIDEMRISSVIERDFHLSNPYLFRDEDQLYCIPEGAESGRVTLFKAAREGDGWHELGTLIDFPAIDPTVFRHSERWWLLCTSPDACELPSASTKLYVWFSDILTGPWRPHPLNPVKVDVRSSRPAGPPFLYEGRLYRPAQDCSETYGGAISLVEILELTDTSFAERLVARIAPDPNGPYPHGFHTLVSAGSGSVIDGKRWVFSLQLPWIKILRRLDRSWRYVSPHFVPTGTPARRLTGSAPCKKADGC